MKLTLRSYSNLLLSVRRITQENQGKNTPEIDGYIATNLQVGGYSYSFAIKTKDRRGKDKIISMVRMSTIPIERWEKVKNNASPDDPELITYWNKRQTKQGKGKTHWTKGSKLYRVADN
ncbi:MAG: hypothetical protein Tsb0014_40590 [Pleurocapsa sp.]